MSNTPAINRKALDLLHIYTGHTFRISRLAGDGMKEQRRQIMSALMGQRMPVSKSGITAIARHFYLMAGPALDGYTCEVDREDKLAAWGKGIVEKKCEACHGTGYYGDNGPGIKGNSEYQACDQCEAGRGK